MKKEDIKILVVDDMPVMRMTVSGILDHLGYRCTNAGNGIDAYTKLRRDKFNLVISDLNMPKLDGIGLLRRIRSDEKLKDLPFLMLTGESEKDKVVEAITEGVTAYIVKPVNGKMLEEKLDLIFGN